MPDAPYGVRSHLCRSRERVVAPRAANGSSELRRGRLAAQDLKRVDERSSFVDLVGQSNRVALAGGEKVVRPGLLSPAPLPPLMSPPRTRPRRSRRKEGMADSSAGGRPLSEAKGWESQKGVGAWALPLTG